MSTHASENLLQSPPGYQVQSSLLQAFERGLDPLHPQASRIPCRVLGYGEISTVFEIRAEGLQDLAFKRMPCFENLDELQPYVDTYLAYNRILEGEVGLRVPPYGYATLICENGRPIFYIIQQRLQPASIGNNALHKLAKEEIILLFQRILGELQKVWIYNQVHPECQLGIDGQISNWAIEGFDPECRIINPAMSLVYIDTSTPFLRLNGVEQLNAELFLRSAPPYLVWILRTLFLQDVMTRYYDARKVIIDLIANFYKEQRSELVPALVAAANDFLKRDGATFGLEEIKEKEVSDYYREDKIIWSLYLGMRRFDRYLRLKVLRREYPYILPRIIRR